MAQSAPLNHAAHSAWPIPARAGIGLRHPHHAAAMQGHIADWLEVHPENYMRNAAAARDLDQVRCRHALSLHGVGLSLGSADGTDAKHLLRLREMVARYTPGLVSDHLSWSAIEGVYLPDLLPLPYTQEALGIVAANIARSQDVLKRQLLIENPSVYFRVPDADMSEAEFLGELVRRTGCGVLLDVNNIYVSARNQGLDPSGALHTYTTAIPAEAIGEFHLAGHMVQRRQDGGEVRIDSHGSRVAPAVWRLFESAVQQIGQRPTLIEWDSDIPALDVLQMEAARAQDILDAALSQEENGYALAG
jgi:uncharacterized protein (UPF0276 family)